MKRVWPLTLLALSLAALGWLWRRQPAAESKGNPRPSDAAATQPAYPATSPGNPGGPPPELTHALTLPNPAQRAQESGRQFQIWLERDPEAALAYVRPVPRSALSSQGLLMALDAVGRRDPDRALGLASELISTRDERAFYSSIFDRLARESITAALPRLAAVPSGEAHENALRALTDAWVRADFAAAFAWAQNLPAADRLVALETTLLDLAPRDPLQAIELAQKSLVGRGLERVVLTALETLSATDPPGAARLVSLLPPGPMQAHAALAVARTLGAQSPHDAVAWINTLPAGPTQILALNNALAGWSSRDSAAAASYVAAMPPSPLQHAAAIDLANLLGSAHPQNAIAWAQSLPALETRPVALTNIVSAWAQRDPAAATRWAAAQSHLPPAALRGAVSYWLLQDAVAARAWIDSADLPPETKARLRSGAR